LFAPFYSADKHFPYNLRFVRRVPITTACPQTPQHAATPDAPREMKTLFQLRQPPAPESRVRGVVGVRVLCAAFLTTDLSKQTLKDCSNVQSCQENDNPTSRVPRAEKPSQSAHSELYRFTTDFNCDITALSKEPTS
jgi:hypothetical protein